MLSVRSRTSSTKKAPASGGEGGERGKSACVELSLWSEEVGALSGRGAHGCGLSNDAPR